MAVSYEQFLDAWNKSKWRDEWSQSDQDLAKLHPEFGMSMLSLKDDWHNATTPEQRAIANEGAEYQRKTWGNYTGGTDGSKYYSLGPLHEEADKKQQEITGYGPFDYSRAPDYQGVMDRVLNYGEFSYDPETDPVYSSYRKTYAREGRRASEDTLGQYSALTGGRPSTAAMTAAQQAGNYYSSQIADKIPELYQQAYQRYLQEYQRQLQTLDAMNADRNFEYGVYGDDFNRLLTKYDTVRGQENAEREQQNAEEATKYQRKIYQDETDYAREQDRLNRERQAVLDQYDVDQDEYKRKLEEAELGMSIGDYSKLEELGYTPDWNAVLNAELASQGRTVPIGSGSGGSGATSAAEDEAVNPYSSSIVKSAWDAYLKGDRSNAVVGALLQAGLLGENGELYENIQTEPEKETWSEREKWAYSVISNPNSTEDALAMAKTILGDKWDFNENTGNDAGSQSLAGRAFNAARNIIQGNTAGSQPQASGIPSDTTITNGHTDAWVDVGGTRYSYDELSEALGKTIGYEYNDKTGTIRFYKMK